MEKTSKSLFLQFFIQRVSPPCQYRLLRVAWMDAKSLHVFRRLSFFIYTRAREREKFRLMDEKEREYWTRIHSSPVWIHIYIYIAWNALLFLLSPSLQKFVTLDRLIERSFLFKKCKRMCCESFLFSPVVGSMPIASRVHSFPSHILVLGKEYKPISASKVSFFFLFRV